MSKIDDICAAIDQESDALTISECVERLGCSAIAYSDRVVVRL